MKTRIQAILSETALRQNIEILYACESGSRAWGFPSQDSDYDVRFIYKRSMKDYLGLANLEDHLSFPINDELDLYGWDIRKVLQLLRKSNSTPFEWLQSPVVYHEAGGFKATISALLPHYFNARSQAFHYIGIAKGALEAMQASGIKVKKLFYVIRPLLAVEWILTKNSYPPMAIAPLLTIAPSDIRDIVQSMIGQKATGNEGDRIAPPARIMDFIQERMQAQTTMAASLEHQFFPVDALNDFFIKTIS